MLSFKRIVDKKRRHANIYQYVHETIYFKIRLLIEVSFCDIKVTILCEKNSRTSGFAKSVHTKSTKQQKIYKKGLTTDRSDAIIYSVNSFVIKGGICMEKGNTKQEILAAALELFSERGFEATSVSQITKAVGIQKASLYSHFDSKQAILDELEKTVLDSYNKHSFISLDNTRYNVENWPLDPCGAVSMIQKQIKFVLHDPYISRARRMLVIGQFQNPNLSDLLTKQNYSDIMERFESYIRRLISQNILKDGDTEIMAAQLCLPISEWLSLCDREPNRESEVMELIDRHIHQFFSIYKDENKN